MTNQFVQYFNYPFLYAVNCPVSVASNTTITIGVGQVRDNTNTFDILVDSPLILNSAVNGVNGLDTGTIAASTWYAVYAIYDITGLNVVAGLISTSATAPLMPSKKGVTYGSFRLIGWVRTDGSSNFIPAYILGNGNEKTNVWQNGIQVLNAGSATTGTNINCSAGVAPIDNTLTLFDISFTAAVGGNNVTMRPFGSAAIQIVGFSSTTAAIAQLGQVEVMTSLNAGNATAVYGNSAAACSTTLYVRSFKYFI
jgi:hypothetical protein